MIRLVAFASLAALSLAACEQPAPPADAPAPAPSAPAPTPPAPAGDVLTAEGFGPLRIGMTRAEVEAALGSDANPNAVGGPDPETCDEFHPARAPEGMNVMNQNGRLTRITATRSGPRTEAGVGVGDGADAVRTAYGARALFTPHKYVDAPAGYATVWAKNGGAAGVYVENPEARGVVFDIDAGQTVKLIHVGGPSIQYVEGCL